MNRLQAFFKPVLRRNEKAESREHDQERVAAGSLQWSDLRPENGLFSGMRILKMEILDRHVRLKD